MINFPTRTYTPCNIRLDIFFKHIEVEARLSVKLLDSFFYILIAKLCCCMFFNDRKASLLMITLELAKSKETSFLIKIGYGFIIFAPYLVLNIKL